MARKKQQAEPEVEKLQVSVSRAIKARLQAYATLQGKTVSEVVEKLIRDHIPLDRVVERMKKG